MKKLILIITLVTGLAIPQIANAGSFSSTGKAFKDLGNSITSDVKQSSDNVTASTKSTYNNVVDSIDDTTFKTQQKINKQIEKDKANWAEYQKKQEVKKEQDKVKQEKVKKSWSAFWTDFKGLFTK